MSEVTRILSAIEQGDPQAAEQLLPLVYEELRKLAAQKLAQEKPGQTLQATALVHEAYVRLVDVEAPPPSAREVRLAETALRGPELVAEAAVYWAYRVEESPEGRRVLELASRVATGEARATAARLLDG